MTCLRCQQNPHPHGSSPRRCAFDEAGAFAWDNWSCATMAALRELIDGRADGHEHRTDGDQTCRVLPVSDLAFLILSIYKDRGRVEGAWLLIESDMIPLTLARAEAILEGRAWSRF